MIPRTRVQWYAHDSGVALEIAEREIVLTYVLCCLDGAGLLGGLAFKGGTAIRKLYLGTAGRFSLDLDFTATREVDPQDLMLRLASSMDGQTFHGISFAVQPGAYWATPDSCGVEVTYGHEWLTDARFRLEVSCRSLPLIPPRPADLAPQRYFQWMEIAPCKVPALDLHEVIGEKIRAALQRTRVRDVYDLYQFADKPYDREVVRRIAVLKCWETRYAFDPAAFLRHVAHARYEWSDLRRLVPHAALPRPDDTIGSVQVGYAFLADLQPDEARLASDPHGREVELYHRVADDVRSKFA